MVPPIIPLVVMEDSQEVLPITAGVVKGGSACPNIGEINTSNTKIPANVGRTPPGPNRGEGGGWVGGILSSATLAAASGVAGLFPPVTPASFTMSPMAAINMYFWKDGS